MVVPKGEISVKPKPPTILKTVLVILVALLSPYAAYEITKDIPGLSPERQAKLNREPEELENAALEVELLLSQKDWTDAGCEKVLRRALQDGFEGGLVIFEAPAVSAACYKIYRVPQLSFSGCRPSFQIPDARVSV